MSRLRKAKALHRKMNRELGHEAPNNYYIIIGDSDKFWKVVKSKKTAEKIADTLRKKGKKVSTGPTSAPVSESNGKETYRARQIGKTLASRGHISRNRKSTYIPSPDGYKPKANPNRKVPKSVLKQREKEFMKEVKIKTDNAGRGYSGEVGDDPKEYAAMHAKLKKLLGADDKMLIHFLDSSYGRHLASMRSDAEIKKAFRKFKVGYNPGEFESVNHGGKTTFFEMRKRTTKAPRRPEDVKYEYEKLTGKKMPAGTSLQTMILKLDQAKRAAKNESVNNVQEAAEMTDAQKQKMKNLEKRAAAGNSQAKRRLAAFKKELGMDDGKEEPKKAEKPKQKRGEYDKADDNVIMQLRKAQDVDGNMEIKFKQGKTGRASKEDIDAVLKFHDALRKPQDKRKLRIALIKGGPAAVKKFADAFRKAGKK